MPHRIRMNPDIISEAAKSAPPAAVTVVATASGISLNNFIGVATLFYIVLQAGYLVWKWRRDIKRERLDRQAYIAAIHTQSKTGASS